MASFLAFHAPPELLAPPSRSAACPRSSRSARLESAGASGNFTLSKDAALQRSSPLPVLMKPPPIRPKTPIKPVNPARARTQPLAALSRKVQHGQLASELHAGASMREFIAALPETLAAADLRELARRIAAARRAGRSFLMLPGGHPLKGGPGPSI